MKGSEDFIQTSILKSRSSIEDDDADNSPQGLWIHYDCIKETTSLGIFYSAEREKFNVNTVHFSLKSNT